MPAAKRRSAYAVVPPGAVAAPRAGEQVPAFVTVSRKRADGRYAVVAAFSRELDNTADAETAEGDEYEAQEAAEGFAMDWGQSTGEQLWLHEAPVPGPFVPAGAKPLYSFGR